MTKTIAERLTDYRNSEDFKTDLASFKVFAEVTGSSESDEEIIIRMLKDYAEQLEAQDACERDGHLWHEVASYPEDGASDMECDRCGESWRISFTA